MLPDVGVIALVPDAFGWLWQPRHQVLTRLAQYFHVVWCDRPHQRRDIFAARRRRARPVSSDLQPRGFHVYSPEWWLPEIGRPEMVGKWTFRERLRGARRILEAAGCRKIVLYLWRPEHAPALDLAPHDLSCYHIDDEYTFSPVEQPTSDRERHLIARVDRVFIHSPALLEKKGKLNRNTSFVPNGVDFRAYATPQAEPADLRPVPHPRVGYVGRIKGQLDLPLAAALAARHPEWSFVFVGPQSRSGDTRMWVERLARLPNVHFLGEKRVDELPAYTQHFDVCAMWYVMNDYTNFIYPLKLHEYLAAGRPVVATPIRSVREFAGVVELATSEDEWSRSLVRALSDDEASEGPLRARQRVASSHDWSRLVRRVAQEMCEGLGPAYSERLRQLSPTVSPAGNPGHGAEDVAVSAYGDALPPRSS